MKSKNKHITFIIGSLCLLLVGLFLAITLGASKIKLVDIYNSIFHYSQTTEMMLIRDVRIPRALCVLITGGILGVIGAMIQGVTRNPIAEPSLLGVSQGAILVIAILYAIELPITQVNVMIAAFIGAFLSGLLVIGFTLKKASNMAISKLLLAGTSMSTFFISLTTIIGLLTNRSQLIAFWVSGGFRTASWNDLKLLLIVGIPGLFITFLLTSKINLLSLGDDVAIGLGVNPYQIRFFTLVVMIPLCAVSVAVGKNIAFVGLFVPQIVRMLLGEDYRKLIPCSFLLGAVILTYADVAARLVYAPYEMPIGIFTALIGIPFFIKMARKERG
ncbi:FecCD family ABC transporter permease [Clostridium sp. Marseille-P299]|uniref:FecCD family ABC transporter permease n=1 Tax=Clostridium sp. Marseille-P299 TaxID=1805477 RepID=UPI00082E9F89|nr:iron ABC transporter permease [Clostridium sp. Marseille-P299]